MFQQENAPVELFLFVFRRISPSVAVDTLTAVGLQRAAVQCAAASDPRGADSGASDSAFEAQQSCWIVARDLTVQDT